jgi:hypothetical protein
MQRQFWVEGVREELVFKALDSIREEHGSRWFEDTACHLLRGLGYMVSRQVIVPDRGDGLRGKVDIVAAKPFVLLALEIDRCTPRTKSIFKVRQIKGATMRLVYCRQAVNERRMQKFLRSKRKHNYLSKLLLNHDAESQQYDGDGDHY